MAPILRVGFFLSALVAALTPLAAAAPEANGHRKCRKPAIRKEWRELGRSGQKAFADAIKCLGRLPHDPSLKPTGITLGLPPVNPHSSLYDDAVYTHMDAFTGAHFTGRFMAWHRHFLQVFEDKLREKCGYKGHLPYWNWNLDYKDVKHSSIWDPNPDYGLGAFPTAASGYNLTTGAFRKIRRAYPVANHRIQRNFTLRPYTVNLLPLPFDNPTLEANSTATKAEWDKIVSSFPGDYAAFQAYLDGHRAQGMHNAVHLMIGGDLANVQHSPNDPMFWLLHSQVDRIWAAWQRYDPRNLRAVGGGEIQALPQLDDFPVGKPPAVTENTIIYLANFGPNTPIKNMFETKGDHLCYEYSSYE